MKKLRFEISINAPRKKVWEAVVNDQPYREWTSVFFPGSYFDGGWNKGDKIRFLAKNSEGQLDGMSSEIAESRLHEFISIRHLGVIKNGVEDTTSDEAVKWAPAYENYTLSESGGTTSFVVDIDIDDSYQDMFNEMWPKALKKLKEISES
ncbi:MAG: SRPBCC domain-containing protein [Spirochaetes bacterium]|nr:MAG: SRPBCC domain-containing protein [Spirochaetota bacterium]